MELGFDRSGCAENPCNKRVSCAANNGQHSALDDSRKGHYVIIKGVRCLGTHLFMPPLELAVVLPTFNERQNVRPVLDRLEKALQGVAYEVIFVDDNSPDGTADEVRSIALSNSRVRVIQRIGRRGLASACVEGMMASPAPYIAIMDADLQHDETVLPQML